MTNQADQLCQKLETVAVALERVSTTLDLTTKHMKEAIDKMDKRIDVAMEKAENNKLSIVRVCGIAFGGGFIATILARFIHW